jgi:hypothetical protein
MASSASSTYAALVCPELSKSFEEGIAKLEVRRLPRQATIGPDDVRIRVVAAATNFFGENIESPSHVSSDAPALDLLMLVGKYQYKPNLPFVVVFLLLLGLLSFVMLRRRGSAPKAPAL